jgi:two-component system phosphate regulon sensor histidine kinase PhoR
MTLRQLIRRLATIFGLVVLSVIVFYFVIDHIIERRFGSAYYPHELPALFTYVYIGFSFAGSLITVVFLVRDYWRKQNFLKEIQQFCDMVKNGSIHGRVFFRDYPDLADVYYSLNQVVDELKNTFSKVDNESFKLNAIVESIPDALLIIDHDNAIVYSNDKARMMLKVPGEILGRPLIEIVRSLELLDLLDGVKQSDKSELAEICLDTPVERCLQVRLSPFYMKNNLQGVVVLFHDITEIKKLEAMRRDFVANVSNEIKTPIATVRNLAEALIEGALQDRAAALKSLETIRFHGQRLGRIVEDLLTISKLELGVMRLEMSEVDFSDVADTVIETLKGKAGEKNIHLKKAPGRIPFRFSADRDKLIHLLINLTENAIKFTHDGGVELGSGEDRAKNFFYVKDTGAGVPKRYISRLGERFFRVDTSISRELGGTGLGLAIVKHIVMAHEWEMKIESEEGKGTTVKIFVE